MSPAWVTPAWRIRAFQASDEPYIVDTWVSHAARHLGRRMRHLKPMLRDALRSSATSVACLPDDLDAILGYLIRDSAGVVLMAYTRSSARNLGIQKDLGR